MLQEVGDLVVCKTAATQVHHCASGPVPDALLQEVAAQFLGFGFRLLRVVNGRLILALELGLRTASVVELGHNNA